MSKRHSLFYAIGNYNYKKFLKNKKVRKREKKREYERIIYYIYKKQKLRSVAHQ